MTLPNPVLPQATDNTIHSSDIALVGGVAVSIPAYADMHLGDLISVSWDYSRIAATVIVNGEVDFPVVFLIPDELTPVGEHSVSYAMEDEAGNLSISNSLTIIID